MDRQVWATMGDWSVELLRKRPMEATQQIGPRPTFADKGSKNSGWKAGRPVNRRQGVWVQPVRGPLGEAS